MSDTIVLAAPSALGLFPGGVEELPQALIDAGLLDEIGGRLVDTVHPELYDHQPHPETGIRNTFGLRRYAVRLADALEPHLAAGATPVVLGGDCSILLGTLTALRRRGRVGLLFLDGHADFYQPDSEPRGEAASMDLALASGRGPNELVDIEGSSPLVADRDIAAVGRRDALEASVAGSPRIEDTSIAVWDLERIREIGPTLVASEALDVVGRAELDGFWLHLDCDVVADDLMPAVDYRLPGGLTWEELEIIVAAAVAHESYLGMEITIFNPRLDANGELAANLVSFVARVLAGEA
jgi:arginase